MAYLAQRLTKDIHNSGLPAFMPGMGQAVHDFKWNKEGIDWERVAQKARVPCVLLDIPLLTVFAGHISEHHSTAICQRM